MGETKRARIVEFQDNGATAASAPPTAGRSSGQPTANGMEIVLVPQGELNVASTSRPRRQSKAKDTTNIGPRKKARSNSGPVTLPPSREQLHGCLQFKLKKHFQRYDKLHTKPIVPCKFFDEATLKELKLWDKVNEYLNNIGWGALINFAYPTYTELIQEFYATFEYTPPEEFTSYTPNLLRFRLMGTDFKMSYTELNIALGMVTPEIAHTSDFANYIGAFSEAFLYDRYGFWLELSIVKKLRGPDKFRASNIMDPALRILHKFLAHSVSARPKLANKVTQPELCLLWCMKKNVKADFARWLVPQFLEVINSKSLKKVKGLILGPYITKIAMHYGLLNDTLHVAGPIEKLDTRFLLAAYILRNREGVLELTPPGETLRDNLLKKGSRGSKRAAFEDDTDDEHVIDRIEVMETKLNALSATVKEITRSQALILQGQEKISKLLERALEPQSSSPTPPQPTS